MAAQGHGEHPAAASGCRTLGKKYRTTQLRNGSRPYEGEPGFPPVSPRRLSLMLQLGIVTAVTFVLHGASRAAVGVVSRAAGPCAGADASVGLSGTLKLVVRTTPTAHRCTHRSTPLHTAAPIAAPLPTAAHRCPPTAAPTAAHRCAAAHRCTPLHTAAHRRTAAPLHRCAAAHRCIPLHTAAPLHRCTPLHSCTAALPSCPGLFLRPLCRCARSR